MISVTKLPSITHHYQKVTIHIKEMSIKNDITFLIGENGKGKSTYLKVISNIIVHHHKYIEVPFRFLSEKVRFPSNINAQTYLNEIIRIDNRALKSLCDYWIDILDFRRFLTYEIDELSKGNKQKLNLIQVLSSDVPLYLMDEPFSGLDKNAVAKLMNGLVKSSKQFVITTHIENVYQTKGIGVIYL
jgi:ABC-type multidrug transport system ATPase subunit